MVVLIQVHHILKIKENTVIILKQQIHYQLKENLKVNSNLNFFS